jgi:hypothetical protein
MAAQIATPPFALTSAATNPMRRMLASRSAFEKPSPADRCLRTRSPVEQGYSPAATLEELNEQDVGDRRLPGGREAGQEDCEALLAAGRVGAA